MRFLHTSDWHLGRSFHNYSLIDDQAYVLDQIIGKMKDELLDKEIFYSLKEAEILIEQWRIEYNTVQPHSALGYHPPAPMAIIELTPQFHNHFDYHYKWYMVLGAGQSLE